MSTPKDVTTSKEQENQGEVERHPWGSARKNCCAQLEVPSNDIGSI